MTSSDDATPDPHSPSPGNSAPEPAAGQQVSAVPLGRRNRFGPDLRPLAFPPYRRLFFGGVASAFGSQLTAVAVQQQIFDITNSSAAVGVASLVALVPLVAFGLLGGAIADTHDRRTLLMITSTGMAVSSLGLWVTALVGVHSAVVVMILLALQQGFFAVNQPTRSAIIPRIVPAALVPSANALGFTVFGVAVLGGPLLAGLLIPLLGLPWLYFIEAVTLVLLLYPILKLPPIPPLAQLLERASVMEGLRFLRTQPLILMTFAVDIIAMVFGMPRALFPQMAEYTFGGPVGGGPQLGLLNAAMAIGVLAGGLTSGWLGKIHRQGVAIVLAICLWGGAVAMFGTTSVIWVAVGWLAVGGWADMVSSTFRSTILQTAIEDRMRGRMQGVFTVVVAGGPRVADLVHGFAAEATSTRVAVIGGGVLVIVGTAVAATIGPSLWRYDSTRDAKG
ncbi:MAG: MFS transporter [Actinomycetota bacterium]|nr:MFS transporter [Actinomycetota bacterium]